MSKPTFDDHQAAAPQPPLDCRTGDPSGEAGGANPAEPTPTPPETGKKAGTDLPGPGGSDCGLAEETREAAG